MLYVALLHYPVYNKAGKVVTTSIANMDIHDIARASRTYGVQNFFVVNPLSAQRDLACEIVDHWRRGHGSVFNPHRRKAFELVRIKASLEEVKVEIQEQTGLPPGIIVTGAGFKDNLLTCANLKKTVELINNADYRLEPVRGSGDYNHLAVRSAAVIILDRIMSN